MKFTLKDVVDFCWQHKGKKGFEGYTYEEVAAHIIEKSHEGLLFIVEDAYGLCGACTISVYPGRLYIHHIIGTRAGFATLVDAASKRYSDSEIFGQRGEKLVKFNRRLLWAIAEQALAVKPEISSRH